VFFVETDTPLATNEPSGMFLGSAGGKDVYMIFRGFGRDNVLDFKTLKKLPRHTRKVVYADSCTVPPSRLEQHSVTFKQIPYEVAGF